MNKIIAAFDGLKYSESTAAYALHIASRYRARLVGVFLEDFTYHSYRLVDILEGDDVNERKGEYLRNMDRAARERSVKHFEDACTAAGIEYSLHRDRSIAIQELLHESMFADLIIIQHNETLTHYTETIPSNFIVDLLERSECPVLLVPPVFHELEKIVFLYNGLPGSVFAMKQFATVLPEESLPVDVLCVRKQDEQKELPDKRLIQEWMKLHYPQTNYVLMHGDPKAHISNYLNEQIKDIVVVLGAYQRGSISRLLHASLADVLLKLNVAVFVAHK